MAEGRKETLEGGGREGGRLGAQGARVPAWGHSGQGDT